MNQIFDLIFALAISPIILFLLIQRSIAIAALLDGWLIFFYPTRIGEKSPKLYYY